MSKKIDLTKVGNVTYAVLCPEKGYLKWLDGQAVFTDALPRASGCFNTYELADAARKRAIDKAHDRWDDDVRGGGQKYHTDWLRGRYDDAITAVVVTIKVC
jgi:hypothetical protein